MADRAILNLHAWNFAEKVLSRGIGVNLKRGSVKHSGVAMLLLTYDSRDHLNLVYHLVLLLHLDHTYIIRCARLDLDILLERDETNTGHIKRIRAGEERIYDKRAIGARDRPTHQLIALTHENRCARDGLTLAICHFA